MADPTLTLALKGSVKAATAIKALLDPNAHLDGEITSYLLDEIPRLHSLLARFEKKIEEAEARGLTPKDAMLLTHHVIEEQKRTLDEDKRRRLSNVLINGFSWPDWDKTTHRLMVRLTAELEEEHVARLRRDVRTGEEIQEHNERHFERINREPPLSETVIRQQAAVAGAIERELVARGLLNEEQSAVPARLATRDEINNRKPAPTKIEVTRRISHLGWLLLAHLRDPEDESVATDVSRR